MRAARFSGQGLIAVETVEAPRPAAGEVTVQVAACALCGSDLRPWRQGWPVTPGHEITGRVDQPGHPRHGQRVAVYIPIFCGQCEDCVAGRTHLCARTSPKALIGWQRAGGYAEGLVVPEHNLLPVPDDVPDDLAPLLLDTIGTTAHAARLALRVVAGGRALIVGAGPIGLGAILVLKHFRFGPIDVIDPAAYRCDVAASLGARPTTADEAAAGRYRLVVEASGKDAGRQTALEAVGPEGAIAQVGESDVWSIKETRSIRLKDFFLIRSFYFPIADHADNVEILRRNRAEFARLVDDRADLEGLSDLFQAFSRGERLKPLMVPS